MCEGGSGYSGEDGQWGWGGRRLCVRGAAGTPERTVSRGGTSVCEGGSGYSGEDGQ